MLFGIFCFPNQSKWQSLFQVKYLFFLCDWECKLSHSFYLVFAGMDGNRNFQIVQSKIRCVCADACVFYSLLFIPRGELLEKKECFYWHLHINELFSSTRILTHFPCLFFSLIVSVAGCFCIASPVQSYHCFHRRNGIETSVLKVISSRMLLSFLCR